MLDYFLKAESKSQLYDILYNSGVAIKNSTPPHPTSDNILLDIIGTMYRESWTSGSSEEPVYDAIDGYHANLRVYDANNVDINILSSIIIPPPKTPTRVWNDI